MWGVAAELNGQQFDDNDDDDDGNADCENVLTVA